MKKTFINVACIGLLAFAPAVLHAQNESSAEVSKTERVTTDATATVSGDELYKTVTSNFTNTLTGKLSGLIVKEGTGELGSNNAQFLIRGMGSYGIGSWNTAKIFVDGFEVTSQYLSGLSPAEIETVTVLKDAAALAIYGEKGANGVISIQTKRGNIAKPTINARLRTGVQTPTKINKPLNSFDYASLYNQAVSNDNGMMWSPGYSASQLDAYKNGTGVNVDWYDEVLKSSGAFLDGDVVFNGGSKNARYNINLGYLNNKGIFNAPNTDQTKNLSYEKYNLRANLDFTILDIFDVRLDMGGRIENTKRPNYSISQLFTDLSRYPSNIYNVYDNVEEGNYSGTAVYPNNPYASVNALGWQSYKARTLQTNFSVRERLDMVTPGLYMKQSVSFYSYTLSAYSKTRNYARWHQGTTTTTDETTSITASGYGSNGMQDWKQYKFTAGYDRTFGKHGISAMLNWDVSAYKGESHDSYRYKYNTLNLNGFLHYDYAHRYVAELAFSRFGNDAYAQGNRWSTYPALSLAWVASEENFLKDNDIVNYLKLRASAGLTGSSESSTTSVLSSFNTSGRYLFKDFFTYSYIGSFYTGKNQGSWQTTYVPMFIPNEKAHAEKSMKYDLGIDATLFHGLDLSVDAYLDKRSDILTIDNSLMGYYGKQYYFSNLGKMTSYGVDLTAVYTGKCGDVDYSVNGMMSYNKNRIDDMQEVPTANAFSAKTGRAYGALIGLVADGFYDINDFDANGNLLGDVTPAFGTVQPGDIKYKDLDGNNVIDQNDVTAVGRTEYPEWYYSFGGKVGYKGFDLELQFQGAAGVSANLLDNWDQVVAFVDNGNAFDIAKGAWAYYPTEGIDNRANATYPRLTTQSNENNYQLSSFWVKDASYLKLRTVELGYNFCSEMLKKSGIENLRVYLNANNLFTISSLLKDYNIDPENVVNRYPMMKSFNAGVSITF